MVIHFPLDVVICFRVPCADVACLKNGKKTDESNARQRMGKKLLGLVRSVLLSLSSTQRTHNASSRTMSTAAVPLPKRLATATASDINVDLENGNGAATTTTKAASPMVWIIKDESATEQCEKDGAAAGLGSGSGAVVREICCKELVRQDIFLHFPSSFPILSATRLIRCRNADAVTRSWLRAEGSRRQIVN